MSTNFDHGQHTLLEADVAGGVSEYGDPEDRRLRRRGITPPDQLEPDD